MADHLKRSHNKTLLIFHLVCPIEYRRKIFTPTNEISFKTICLDLAPRYNYHFLEIGMDEDHAHFLIQTPPRVWISGLVQTIKSLTAPGIFERHPEIKQFLWGG